MHSTTEEHISVVKVEAQSDNAARQSTTADY